MTDKPRQCPSCGGVCRKSGCERANIEMNPEKREWVGLTDEEITRLYKEHAKYQEEGMKLSGWNAFAANVQAKLREKNT